MTYPYDKPINPCSVQMDPKKITYIIDLFRKQQLSGSFPGGQMVVRRFGKTVINEHIGIARDKYAEEAPLSYPVREDTPFPVFSSGKPLIAIALLEDRGILDINAPISEILPDFSAEGKALITTLDVLTHTAGILIPSSYSLEPKKQLTWHTIVTTPPMYPRGTFAYMPLEYGIILREILQRITGKNFTEFINEAIAIPLQLPALQYGFSGRPIQSIAHSY